MALKYFDQAANPGPNSTLQHFGESTHMPLFLRANCLMNQERYAEALVDLEVLRARAPKEGTIHSQLGKVHQKLGQDRQALLHFNIAMDLNKESSKDYHQLKFQISTLQLRENP